MRITAQARRRITEAVQTLPDVRLQDQWREWAGQVGPRGTRIDVPYEIAAIALEALVNAGHGLEKRLDTTGLDEDVEADLLNDLGYIRAIETALRNEGVGR